MRVLILQQAALPGQLLTPGVTVEVNDATAAWLVESGAAQTVGDPAPAAAAPSEQPATAPDVPRATRRKAAE